MIELDTHVWVWWVNQDTRLTSRIRAHIENHESDGLGISVLSCWEVALLVTRGRLDLDQPLDRWLAAALAYPGIQVLDFTPAIAVEANRLPGEFHRDPADQILVATARVLGLPLLTEDTKILAYPHVQTL